MTRERDLMPPIQLRIEVLQQIIVHQKASLELMEQAYPEVRDPQLSVGLTTAIKHWYYDPLRKIIGDCEGQVEYLHGLLQNPGSGVRVGGYAPQTPDPTPWDPGKGEENPNR